jgi:peptide/nickel transport system substrate-binding protein
MIHPVSRVRSKAFGGALLLAVLILLAGALSACGSSMSSHGGKQPPLSIVAVTNGDWTRNFNPYNPNVDSGSQGMIYETLVFYNRLDGSVHPWLAVSQQLSTDATAVTYHLRRGVQWSDGQPFSSTDVVFTLRLLKKYPAMDVNGLWNYIQDVAAPDASTVFVKLKQPFAPILWYLGGQTYILSQHRWSLVKGDASQYADPDPVGTGPYVLSTFTPQNYTFVKNPHYWQAGKPEVEKLTFPAFNGNTSSELALDQGKITWAGLYIPDIQQTYIDRDPAHNHYWFPASDPVYLALNLGKYPFNQLAVRQAISLAIDRSQLDKVGENGFEPVAHPTTLLLPFQKDYLAPQYASTAFEMNPTQARQLLIAAGFTQGADGVAADRSGKRLAFNLNVVEGWTDWITDCQIIASDLKAIGIKVSVNVLNYDAYYSALQSGNYDMSLSSQTPGPTPYYWFNAVLNSSNSAPLGQNANSNFERWQDTTTDQLLGQFAATANASQQKQSLAGIEQIMVRQLPVIPLTNEPYWYEYSTAHFTGWPDQNHPYAVPAPYIGPDCEVVLLNLHPVS